MAAYGGMYINLLRKNLKLNIYQHADEDFVQEFLLNLLSPTFLEQWSYQKICEHIMKTLTTCNVQGGITTCVWGVCVCFCMFVCMYVHKTIVGSPD